jgi:hypothetical protein
LIVVQLVDDELSIVLHVSSISSPEVPASYFSLSVNRVETPAFQAGRFEQAQSGRAAGRNA